LALRTDRKSLIFPLLVQALSTGGRIGFLPLTDWERDFLESLAARPPERLSTRQAEVLFEIRDDNELISKIDGNIKVSNLIQRACEARLDLDENDEEWIIAIWNRGTTSLRRRHLGRLKRCCVQLGELEPYVTLRA